MNNEIPTTPPHRRNPLPVETAGGAGTVPPGAAADAVRSRDPVVDPAMQDVGSPTPKAPVRAPNRSRAMWIGAAVVVLIILVLAVV